MGLASKTDPNLNLLGLAVCDVVLPVDDAVDVIGDDVVELLSGLPVLSVMVVVLNGTGAFVEVLVEGAEVGSSVVFVVPPVTLVLVVFFSPLVTRLKIYRCGNLTMGLSVTFCVVDTGNIVDVDSFPAVNGCIEVVSFCGVESFVWIVVDDMIVDRMVEMEVVFERMVELKAVVIVEVVLIRGTSGDEVGAGVVTLPGFVVELRFGRKSSVKNVVSGVDNFIFGSGVVVPGGFVISAGGFIVWGLNVTTLPTVDLNESNGFTVVASTVYVLILKETCVLVLGLVAIFDSSVGCIVVNVVSLELNMVGVSRAFTVTFLT